MKKQFFALAITAVISTICFAQQQKKLPKWISSTGYWTIESNTKTPKNSTIYFYTNNNVMIYKEKVEGVKINTRKHKTLMRLKNVLEQAMIAWENNHKANENDYLVAAAFKR